MSKIQKAIQEARQTKATLDAPLATRPAATQPGRRATDSAARSVIRLDDHATWCAIDEAVLAQNRIVLGSHGVAATTSYKMLRTRMLQRMRTSNWSRIAVSSARKDAGKSLTSVNTAISLAGEPNQKVVLVDLDLRRPTIAGYLGIDHNLGLSDYLQGKARIEDIVVTTSIERLLIIPNFGRSDDSSELLTSDLMQQLVHVLASPVNSTTVLFDLPPILEVDDLLAFSPMIDALLVVVAEAQTRRVDLHKLADLTKDLNVLGYVLNKSRGNEHASGYDY